MLGVWSLTFSLILGISTNRLVAALSWADSYTLSGILKLPYAEINEPFYAYFDGKKGMSRIDYYGGMVQTIQIAGKKSDLGKSYKITPITTEKVLNQRTCFVMNGTKDAAVGVQAALPNTTGFVLIQKNVQYGPVKCQLWQKIEVIGERKNTYSLWVDQSNGYPVRFEMMGYDSLLGSHYDKYYLEYEKYIPQDVQDSVFDPTTLSPKVACAGFSAATTEEHRLLMNPMQEYVNGYDAHLGPTFTHFKNHHRRKYAGKENSQRKWVFLHNLRFIHSHNRGGHSFSVGVNHLADWTDIERKALRGNRQHTGYNGGRAFDKHRYNLKDLPDHKDWRLLGAVTPVKDQAVCGSCWSFGTTGTIEGAYFLKTGRLVRLSQQELIDCSWGEGNNGCDGGDDFQAYQWITKHGLAAEDTYGAGSYLAQDSYCEAANTTATVKTLKGYVNVTSGDQQALMVALAHHGPISVAIDASPRSFSFYANGVFYDPSCGNKAEDLDHAVLAVGYGTINGQSYWLVKNSWSTYWGNNGYILMAQRGNNCGVATDPTFVLL